MNKKPKILVFDIETLPIEAFVWGLHDQHISLEMIKKPTSVCSFVGKFVGEKTFHEFSTRHKRDVRDDKELVEKALKLIDSADILVTQNGVNFDLKKLNSRAYFNDSDIRPDKKKHVDLFLEGKRVFGHDSHKLQWITTKLAASHQKSKHSKFPGFELHREVMLNNSAAWDEMEKYNRQDVIATEEVYHDYMTWFDHIDLRPFFMTGHTTECRACGSTNTAKNGTVRRRNGRFQRYICNACGCQTIMTGAKNNLDKPQKARKS